MLRNLKFFWQAAFLLLLFLGVEIGFANCFSALSAQQSASLEAGVFGYRNESYQIELQILSVSDTEITFKLTSKDSEDGCTNLLEGTAERVKYENDILDESDKFFLPNKEEIEAIGGIKVFHYHAKKDIETSFRLYFATTHNKVWIQDLSCFFDDNACSFFMYNWLFLM
ncbi:hypothetical protein [Hugenholtzia roseola]|uniref:hypothetical protein n=1 Tax=Hugenholtzia roseola TaxID=1002 RepID=UPI00047E7F1C|nr:hypothetical protein [Hugenholtzia roseola]